MRVFESGRGWESKVNFVDEENVLVGYDISEFCCESAEWSFHSSLPGCKANKVELSEGDLLDFRFDRGFFVQGNLATSEELFEGDAVAFRIVSPVREAFIVLRNSQNGYYSHGFEMSVGGVMLRRGSL